MILKASKRVFTCVLTKLALQSMFITQFKFAKE